MKALESRKQLLIAESELNREQLLQELGTLADEVHSLAHQAKTVGFIASAVTTLAVGWSSYRHRKAAAIAAKPSWWQALVQGAGLLGSVWAKIRS